MELSTSAILLIKHTINYTGESETDQRGQEVPSARRLNGEESAQRRHFAKNTESAVNKYYKTVENERKGYDTFRNEIKEKLKIENPKGEGERDADYEGKIEGMANANEDIQKKAKELQDNVMAALKEKHIIELTEKTLAVVKKYYKEFGDKTGYPTGDDENVDEINDVLGLA